MSKSSKPKGKSPPPNPDEILAGEFALGVLNDKKHAQANARMASDPEFAASVHRWQARLAPMLDEAEPIAPPAQVWNQLENRLFGKDVASQTQSGFWSSLAFWRNLSFVAGALATALIATMALRPAWLMPIPAGNQTLVAALNLSEEKPTFLIRVNRQSGNISVTSANFSDTSARVPELWLIPRDGVPRSLGIVTANGSSTFALDNELLGEFEPGTTLAISLEPATGAPEGKPTGPIVALGKLQFI